MPSRSLGRRTALAESHVLFGQELRRARQAAGKTMRELTGYTSGHLSTTETDYVTPSRELILAYMEIVGSASTILSRYDAMKQEGERRSRQCRGQPHCPIDSIML